MSFVYYYAMFVETCESFDVPPKYVIFSIIASLLTSITGLGIRGSLRATGLMAKGVWCATRGTYRLMRPKPNDLGTLILDAMKDASYVYDKELPQLAGRGCVASLLNKTDTVSVAVDGRFVTEDLDPVTIKTLRRMFSDNLVKFEASEKEIEARYAAERIKQTKVALLRARAIEV